jgi:two-component system, sensor histidine kinase YesM
MDKVNGENVLGILKDATTSDSLDFYEKYASIDKFLNEKAISVDPKMDGAFIFKTDDTCFFTSRNYSNAVMTKISQQLIPLIENIPINKDTGQPSYYIFSLKPGILDIASSFYVICYNIFDDNDTNRTIGFLACIYNSETIRQSYQKFSTDILGSIYVLSPDAELLFDSSGKGFAVDSEISMSTSITSTRTFYEKNRIVTAFKDIQYNYVVYGIITRTELMNGIYPLKLQIIAITTLSIAILILLTYMATMLLTRWVKKIINAIKKIQEGDYDIKISYPNKYDEFGQISDNLNVMSNRITEYIRYECIAEVEKKTAELKSREAELKQRTAELYALQCQVNPHFLYNTLESIRMKALTNGENEVSRMIYILASLFRSSIKSELIVSIKSEIDYCKAYLELYKIRYKDKLRIDYSIDEGIYEFGILKHLLQPIIENSIVHGVDLERSDNRISVNAVKMGNDISIVIKDNGKGMSSEKLQQIKDSLGENSFAEDDFGLKNVDQRIRMVYGNGYRLGIESEEKTGTEVALVIRALTQKELMDRVQGSAG